MKNSILITCLVFLAISCSGGDGGDGKGGGGTGGGGTGGDSLATTLDSMGVNTGQTPRKDDTGGALPDDYSPLGSRRAVTKIDEMFLVGIRDSDRVRAPVTLRKYTPGNSPTTGTTDTLFTPSNVSWAENTMRASTAGDIDGDGYVESHRLKSPA